MRKWLIVFLLFLATLLNYLDRQTISVTASVISCEFGLNDAHLGQLFSPSCSLTAWRNSASAARWIALRFARRMRRRWRRGRWRERLVIICGVALMMVVPLISRLRDVNAITACICAATLGLGWAQVSFLTFTSEVSAARTSTATGLLGGAGAISGGLFMLLVGNVVERQGSFGVAFLMAGVTPLVALGGVWLGTSARWAQGRRGSIQAIENLKS